MNYAKLVKDLSKPPEDIQDKLTPGIIDLWHMASGVSGESGELLDLIKKVVVYNKPIDRDKVIKELGDIEFYLEGFRQRFEVSRDEVLAVNHAKLSERYSSGSYSDAQAITRADVV